MLQNKQNASRKDIGKYLFIPCVFAAFSYLVIGAFNGLLMQYQIY